MSVNKNAIIRYQTLDRCFRNPGRRYFWEDLLEECNRALLELNPGSRGIQRRQLFDDMRFMQSEQGWAVPLEKYRFGRRVYYRYSDPEFSINNQPLNESEAEQIRSALRIISRFSGTPQFEWVNEMIPQLEEKLGLIKQEKEAISFESNIDLKGSQHLTPLFNAIVNERVLKITYKDFKSPEPYVIVFHPYYLKQYNNRWFVLGLNDSNDHPYWNMALDRIEALEETDKAYRKSETDWEEFFYDIVGVTRPHGEEAREIILKFTPEIAPYVITKPLHPSQKHRQDDTGLEVRLKVIPNYELVNIILSFAENVEVISPEDLRETVAARLRKACDRYYGEEG